MGGGGGERASERASERGRERENSPLIRACPTPTATQPSSARAAVPAPRRPRIRRRMLRVAPILAARIWRAYREAASPHPARAATAPRPPHVPAPPRRSASPAAVPPVPAPPGRRSVCASGLARAPLRSRSRIPRHGPTALRPNAPRYAPTPASPAPGPRAHRLRPAIQSGPAPHATPATCTPGRDAPAALHARTPHRAFLPARLSTLRT